MEKIELPRLLLRAVDFDSLNFIDSHAAAFCVATSSADEPAFRLVDVADVFRDTQFRKSLCKGHAAHRANSQSFSIFVRKRDNFGPVFATDFA